MRISDWSSDVCSSDLDHPKWVNLGAQKNFARYAARIGAEWKKSSDGFNEFYFKRIVARALIFRSCEKMVSAQPWYNGGYRANIVTYTLDRKSTRLNSSH